MIFPLGPDNPLGYPAPYWFIVFFKALGFTLHMVPMNLWYAGLITMLLARFIGGEQGRRLSDHFLRAMPVVIALGINFGIVPLLFTQVAYYRVFYPATILLAWPWFAVIPLLMLAYYGVYIYVVGLRKERLSRLRQSFGWAAALVFVLIGFIFANNFSLMTRLSAWTGLAQATAVAGAPLGLALNVGDVSLWPRWLMMFGLALTTTAAYVAFDAGFFAGGESETHKQWSLRFALGLATLGLIWFALTGTWYFFGALAAEVRGPMLRLPVLVITLLTAASPGLPWLLLLLAQRRFSRGLALAIGLAQFGVLALNAVSRQIVQNAELAPYLDVAAGRVAIQWSPMILFLVLFAAGIGVVVWMLAQAARSRRPEAPA
jgi:hypothetical protein